MYGVPAESCPPLENPLDLTNQVRQYLRPLRALGRVGTFLRACASICWGERSRAMLIGNAETERCLLEVWTTHNSGSNSTGAGGSVSPSGDPSAGMVIVPPAPDSSPPSAPFGDCGQFRVER